MTQITTIQNGWVETTLGEVAKTNSLSIGKGYEFEEILYLDTGSITEGKIESLQKFHIKEAPSRAKRLINHQDIVYSTVRPNQKHFGFIENPEKNLVVSTGFTVISAKSDKSDAKFLYYLVSQNSITNKLQQIAEHSVSTYPSIKPENLENLDFFLPPLPEQKAIASVLSAFDDKIELLREQNKTLEETGQTIFKEWFGKYSAERPEELPEGWRVGKLGEEIETFLGGTPAKNNKEFWENGDVAWINSGVVNDFRITQATEFITKKAVEKSATKLLPKGTVVLAITGATLGQYSRLEIDCCFNQSVVGIKENKTFHSSFIYFWIAENINEIICHATGGAQQHINKENVNDSEIIIPSKDILDNFYQIIDPIMEKISQNCFQIQAISTLRDTLLPKLIKGNVRVKI